jgi:thiol-disulfide isomerase/thioredoxin
VPVIYPFVIYSGKAKYKWPKKSSIEVDGLPILDLSSSLIELREYSLEDLLKSDKAALVQFLLKESWKKDFCKIRKENPQLDELVNKSPYGKEAMFYMIDQDPHGEQLIKEFNLSKNIKEKVMTGLQRIEQRGIKLGEQRGIKLGEQRGKIEGIKLGEQRGKIKGIKLGEQVGAQRGFKDAIARLLSHGIDKAKAAEMLGLTLRELEDFLKA